MILVGIGIDLSFLADIGASKSPLVFLIFSLIGLYSSTGFVIYDEKRMPNRFDFLRLVVFIPFVGGFALLVGISPFISLFIGLAPEPIFKIAKRNGVKVIKKLLGEKYSGDSDDDYGDNADDSGKKPKKDEGDKK
jgi:hypothetical protein